jgi:hypothetical protein
MQGWQKIGFSFSLKPFPVLIVNRIELSSLCSDDPYSCEVLTRILCAAAQRPAFSFIRF